MTITVVSGAPCAGKTTYVADNRKDGDVVVDLDALAGVLGGGIGPALAARSAVIDHILSGTDTDAWIIDTHLRADTQARYADAGAEFVTLDPGLDTCLARAADRPPGAEDVIRGWYAERAEEAKRYRAVRGAALKLAECYPDRLEDILTAVRERVLS